MKKLLFLGGLALIPSVVLALDITVGATRLSIPAPAGFAPITGDMKPYAEMAKKFVPATNEQFALFVPAAEAALAARGGIPTSDRRFYVQTVKELVQPFVTSADFADVRRAIKEQNGEVMKKAEAQFPDIFKKINQGVADDYKVDLALSLTQMLPLPPHYETDRAMAFSMIVKYQINDANGKPVPYEGVVTATFIHLQGKILFLYVNAEKAGLEWSRAEAKKWADTVVAANPSDEAVAKREASHEGSGFDWSQVGEKALIGGIIGGLIGLARYFFRKKKP